MLLIFHVLFLLAYIYSLAYIHTVLNIGETTTHLLPAANEDRNDSIQFTDRSKSNISFHGEELRYIFIGGFPGSGTTLLRVMLGSHPLVHCERETRVLPWFLGQIQRKYYTKIKRDDNEKEKNRRNISNANSPQYQEESMSAESITR